MSELETAGYESSRAAPAGPNPIVGYFRTLKALLTAPGKFFRELPRPPGVVGPLVFGIVTNWIGTALEYLWFAGFGKIFQSRMDDLLRAFEKGAEIDSTGQARTLLDLRERFAAWAFGVGTVLADPFLTAAKILFLSLFVWLGARLFASLAQRDVEERLSYESAVSIVGFSLAASIFKGIPILGGLIAGVFCMVIAVIGAMETYRVGAGRGILIALFPTILFWGLILASVFAFFGAIAMLFFR